MKRALLFVLPVLLLCLFAADSATAKAWFDTRGEVQDPRLEKINQYSFPQKRSKPVAIGDWEMQYGDADRTDARRNLRVSLGDAQAGGIQSTGFTVDVTYQDDQYRPPAGRMVSFRGADPSIHFSYSDAGSAAANSRYGYNVYDPTGGGSWPRGAQVGCEVQPNDATGQWVMNDVDDRGFIVLAGEDDAGGSLENHFYFQSAQHSCFWGAGSIIPSSQYDPANNFLDATNHLSRIKIEIQYPGSDTVLHVLAGEREITNPPATPDLREGAIEYFRRVGAPGTGSWAGPVVIDTTAFYVSGSLAASRATNDVAVSYTHYHDFAYINNQVYDEEIYFRRSTDAGVTWGPPTNLTNYPRTGDQASHSAFVETATLFDSEGGLHIVFNATPIVADPYNDPTFFWGEFSASLFHWTDRVAGPNAGGTITRIHNAEWGIDFNTQVCGFGSPGTMYVGYFDISECNGNLYTTFTQYLDAFGNFGQPQIDDCPSGGFSDRQYAANGEVAVSVSTSLDGLLWDAARNISQTYTPGCDSAGFGGVCMNDTRVSAARYGMDSAGYGEDLSWPGTAVLDLSGSYTGSHYLHIMYLEDHFPGPGWRNVDQYNQLTANPLRWVRLACVDPVPAAQITVNDRLLGYPDFVPPGDADTITITVTNDGNVPLTISEINPNEDGGGPTGWLSTSLASLNVGAGVSNTATFDIIIDASQFTDPQTLEALNGDVQLISDAANEDTLTISIVNYMVVSEVTELQLDTVSTGTVSLVVTSTGEMGYNGGTDGQVNLDYVESGLECNISTTDPNTSVYLYSGGPLVLRNDGADNFTFSYATFQQQFSTNRSFRGIPTGAAPKDSIGPNFDGYFTGTAVNSDTSISIERTYYAPTSGADSNDFVIVKTDIWATDGGSVSGLAIGEFVDWDIPNDDGATNVSGVLTDHNTVYQQGVDTATTVPCQLNADRFGGTMLLGYATSSELDGDPCAGTCTPHGVYSWRNDSLFSVDDTLEAAYFWEKMAVSGLSADPSETDLHSVMTHVYDYTLPAAETLTVYTVVSSVLEGTTADLEANFDAAFEWYRTNLRTGCDQLCGCCVGIRGNADGDAGDVVDVGDLTYLIGFLFLGGPAPDCPEEGNVDGAGATDVGDLTALIGFLFLGGNPPADC